MLKKATKGQKTITGFIIYDKLPKHSFLGVLKQNLLKLIGLKRMIKHYNNICSKYSDSKSQLVSNFSFWADKGNVWNKTLWENLSQYQFEYLKVPGPKDYDSVLREEYGEYEKYVIGTSEHGDVFFDTEKPYTYYLNEGREGLERYAGSEY